ncbi:2-C-methyl-D-erythritol 4-phosphate cytidylyltransferase [Salinicoccus halodurans]|uniref:2-C-methyl-D-erythritol 4-phosphate cytidylyltransferase n=2 Tax=Salinicoccus halodurans TaxID=407035 RepID=A0A0F7HN96_9STAP|nr:2-C-methyl-D-erythritol 4-phosphate cytidylyltransferase [Salinicoccus halodurans]AKG75099.1 2-C-methyl-D-erythritol 4-phosphate cytidylyltransferase [Salinicoccus halodurans]SFK65747.1 2-C-methyl-D-erythritol 4-phosphate cytidylyltransferase [Salinicoccus halodurans]
MKYTAIIPAAGMGSRMGINFNKIFIKIGETPIIRMTVEKFQNDPNCEAVHLAGREGEIDSLHEMLAGLSKVKGIHIGGAERQDSIFNALKALSPTDYVFIHDGARPFVRQETLSALSEAVVKNDSVICGVKPKDTLKMISDNQVQETVDRENVIIVHTPQAFRYDLIMDAHENAAEQNLAVTDDSMMMEALGYRVHVVPSSYDNIKITTEEDLKVAESILKKESELDV